GGRPEDRPDENVERLPALVRVFERERRVRQGQKPEDQVVPEEDPGGERRPGKDRDAVPLELPEHVVEEDDRRNRVDQIEESRARREKLLQPALPARRRLPRPFVGLREREPLFAGKDEEEVEEDRGQK